MRVNYVLYDNLCNTKALSAYLSNIAYPSSWYACVYNVGIIILTQKSNSKVAMNNTR